MQSTIQALIIAGTILFLAACALRNEPKEQSSLNDEFGRWVGPNGTSIQVKQLRPDTTWCCLIECPYEPEMSHLHGHTGPTDQVVTMLESVGFRRRP